MQDVITNMYILQKSLPRLRYGGYPNPEVLYILIRRIRPKILVETGVSFGVTSSFILQALEDNGEGKLYSIDLPFQFAKENETGSLVPIRLRHRWKLILGDSKTELSSLLNDLKRIDFLFIDGDHTYEGVKRDFLMYSPLVRKGGIIAFHDIVPHPPECGGDIPRFWD